MERLLEVLLVDDDLLILDDLATIIDWEANGFKVVASVYNGNQALDYIRKHHVDIVIADIEMPQLNGLAFIKKLNSLYSSIETILLTSFSKFDYAREAISLGVHNYLLKHELTDEILLKNLNEVKQKINQTSHILISEDNLLFTNALNSTNDELLASIFHFAKTENGLVLIKILPRYNLKQWFQQDYEHDLMLKLLNDQDVLYLKHKYPFYILETNINEWTVGLETDDNNRYLPFEFIYEMQKYTQSNHVYSFVVSDVIHTTELLKKTIDKYNKVLSKLFYTNSNIINLRDITMNTNALNDDWYEQIIRIETIRDCIEITKKYMNWLETNTPSLEVCNITIQKLLQTMHKMLGFIHEENQDDFEKWQLITNFKDFKEFVASWLDILNNAQGYSRKTSYVMQYLNKNMDKDNVLDLLCEDMGMNKDYLSRLVKKECGSSLSTLLLDIRLDKAMFLLKTSNDKVYEIATKCGFNTSQYFSIVFYKKFKIYPKDVSKELLK